MTKRNNDLRDISWLIHDLPRQVKALGVNHHKEHSLEQDLSYHLENGNPELRQTLIRSEIDSAPELHVVISNSFDDKSKPAGWNVELFSSPPYEKYRMHTQEPVQRDLVIGIIKGYLKKADSI